MSLFFFFKKIFKQSTLVADPLFVVNKIKSEFEVIYASQSELSIQANSFEVAAGDKSFLVSSQPREFMVSL